MQWANMRNRLRPRLFFCAGLGVALLAVPGLAKSATLDVVDGKLMGAYNVVVPTDAGTRIYNVKFIDGYCGEVFTGCGGTIGSGTYPFAFDVGPAGVFPWDMDAVARVAANTRAAAQALLEQVFIDSELGRFDSEHRLTNGCVTDITTGGCNAVIPFGVQHPNFSVWATAAGNASWEIFDAVSVGGDQVIDYDYSSNDGVVWAVFTLAGSSPESPLIGSTCPHTSWCFDILEGRAYYDPVVAVGYDYQTNDPAALFTTVTIPYAYGDGQFDLLVLDEISDQLVDSGIDIAVGEIFDFSTLGFPGGVAKFGLRGIEPEASVDPADPLGFVTGLTFSGGSSLGFVMTPVTIDTDARVPEPATFLLFGLGAVGVLLTCALQRAPERADRSPHSIRWGRRERRRVHQIGDRISVALY